MNKEKILTSTVNVSNEYFRNHNIKKTMSLFLDELLQLTESEYGFIGIIKENSQQKYLKTLVITDISWDNETKKLYEDNAESGLEFFNLDSLFGQVISTTEPVISNDPANDHRACGIPLGHPALNCFLGIPFKIDNDFVGMCGLANRPGGYKKEMITELEPINNCIANLTQNFCLKQERKSLNTRMEMKEGFISKIFKSSAEAIISINCQGIIQSVSHCTLKLFGYTEKEMIGKNVNIIVEDQYKDKHDSYLKKYLETGETRIINTIRELQAKKKDGSLIPIELSVNEIKVGKERIFLGIIRDLTLQKEYIQKIEAAKKAAEMNNKAKSEFLAIMSHELNTPLNAVMGSLQLLMTDEDLNENQNSLLKIAYRSSQDLLSSLNSIQDYSRLKVGLFDLDETKFKLRTLLNEIDELMAKRALSKGLDFSIHYEGFEDKALISDSYRIKQVLLNIIDNAVKFTQKGSITVNVDMTDIDENSCYCRFSVKDTGCGIPKNDLEKIFNDFDQVDSSSTRAEGGFGLGLSISLLVAKILDGTINIDSTPGIGSEIIFTLPLKVDQAEKTKVNLNKVSKLLVVDDNIVNQRVLCKMLSKLGIEADVAGNGKIAVKMFTENSYDLIFMDLMMPEMNGFEAALKIREKDKEVPIITVTANNSAEEVKKSRECGMNDFVSKPVSKERLMKLIRKYNIIPSAET